MGKVNVGPRAVSARAMCSQSRSLTHSIMVLSLGGDRP
jgi:hypothetical protein